MWNTIVSGITPGATPGGALIRAGDCPTHACHGARHGYSTLDSLADDGGVAHLSLRPRRHPSSTAQPCLLSDLVPPTHSELISYSSRDGFDGTGRGGSGCARCGPNFASNAGRSERMRGMRSKLRSGGGQLVGHSRGVPYPPRASTGTLTPTPYHLPPVLRKGRAPAAPTN